MSTFTTTTTPTAASTATQISTDGKAGRVSWKRGLTVVVAAAAAVTVLAAAFQVAGHTLSVTDGPIPALAFGQLVLIFGLIGILIARHTGRTTFYRVTIALTVLSCVPDAAFGDGFLSKAGLMLTHVVAATIIIPRLARR